MDRGNHWQQATGNHLRQFGFNLELWVSPLSQTIILLCWAIVAAKLCPTKDLAGFILAIAALTFGWRVVVPWIEASSVFHAVSHHLSWAATFFFYVRSAQSELFSLSSRSSAVA